MWLYETVFFLFFRDKNIGKNMDKNSEDARRNTTRTIHKHIGKNRQRRI